MTDQEFPGLPDDAYRYTNQFSYSVWTPGTVVSFANVPWDSSYRDVYGFKSDDERDEYFDTITWDDYSVRVTGCVYLRLGEPIRLAIAFPHALRFNYMVVENPLQPVPHVGMADQVENRSQRFFYFITDVKYIAPNTTEFNVQLDVWTTFRSHISLGTCYIVRGHLGIANENATVHNLASYMTEPEGLNYGTDYEVTDQEFRQLNDSSPIAIIVTTASFKQGFGTLEKPVLTTSTGSEADGMINGCEVYACESSDLPKLMKELSNAPWVSQCVQMVTVVPRIFVNMTTSAITIGSVKLHSVASNPFVEETSVMYVNDAINRFHIEDRYSHLLKFHVYPYTFFEVTNFEGSPLVLKPECLDYSSNNAQYYDALSMSVESSIAPPFIRAVVYPRHYASSELEVAHGSTTFYTPSGESVTRYIPQGEYLDSALVFSNFPQLSIVNNMYQYYLASTVNTRAWQNGQADWSQQKANAAAQLSYDQASSAISNMGRQQEITNQLTRSQADVQNAYSVYTGVRDVAAAGWNYTSRQIGLIDDAAEGVAGGKGGKGAAVGGLLSAGTASVQSTMQFIGDLAAATGNTIADIAVREAQTGNTINAGNLSTGSNMAAAEYNRDTNYDYANWAAKGDYEQAISQIQAKVQDAAVTLPSVSGQYGGNIFNATEGYCAICVKFKRIRKNARVQLGEYWLRYGYAINRWLTPEQANMATDCMENFTYVKMLSCSLIDAGGSTYVNAMPEVYKDTFRGIFEKGVTIWSNPFNMNIIDLAENPVKEGVGY